MQNIDIRLILKIVLSVLALVVIHFLSELLANLWIITDLLLFTGVFAWVTFVFNSYFRQEFIENFEIFEANIDESFDWFEDRVVAFVEDLTVLKEKVMIFDIGSFNEFTRGLFASEQFVEEAEEDTEEITEENTDT